MKKNTKSTINSDLYLHLCLEYSWWFIWYVWYISVVLQTIFRIRSHQKKHTASLDLNSYRRGGVCVGPSTMACTSRGSCNCCCWWIWKSGVICKMQVICYSITSFQDSRLNSCFCGLILNGWLGCKGRPGGWRMFQCSLFFLRILGRSNIILWRRSWEDSGCLEFSGSDLFFCWRGFSKVCMCAFRVSMSSFWGEDLTWLGFCLQKSTLQQGMRTIARHASCCLEFDSCEQNSFISNCKVPPQYQCSGHKGDIFTKRTKGSTISMGKKLDGSYHANVKHLETKSEFHPWFETLKHWKQPTCCFSSRFVLNRGYCATNRPCQKAWSANWKMLAYIIIHPVKRQYGCCFFLFPQGSGWKLQTQHQLKTTTFSLYN